MIALVPINGYVHIVKQMIRYYQNYVWWRGLKTPRDKEEGFWLSLMEKPGAVDAVSAADRPERSGRFPEGRDNADTIVTNSEVNMYNQFIGFNGNVYTRSRNIFTKKECLVTRFKEKTDESFYEYLDHLDNYARDIGDDDIYDLYEVDFCVFYKDDKMPSKNKGEGDNDVKDGKWWNVNETGSYRLPADIEKDEVSISFYGQNYGIDEDGGNVPEGWEELQTEPGGFYMGGWYAKKVNIHDCAKFRVTYTYKVFEGEYFFRPNKKEAEVFMTAEEFKAEMLKYRLSNI